MFGEKILDYWDDILKDMAKLVSIPSVAVRSDGPHPFGDQCAKVLDAAVEMAQGYGLTAKNVDYYAAHAEYGQGEGNAVVMAHLDVVPAGEGWDGDPFTMAIQDGMAYGRGVADNKGAAIVALHCLRALKDAGVKGNRKLRVIFGSGEEVGMADMGHYFSKEQLPDMGFTPDSSYGICHCEPPPGAPGQRAGRPCLYPRRRLKRRLLFSGPAGKSFRCGALGWLLPVCAGKDRPLFRRKQDRGRPSGRAQRPADL